MAVVDPVGGVDRLTMREVPRGEHISNTCPYFPPHYPHLGTLDCYFASFERYPLRVHWNPEFRRSKQETQPLGLCSIRKLFIF